MHVRDAVNIADLRRAAKRRLPGFVFDFVDGGAEDEITLRANRRAFEALSFRPRLADVSERDTTAVVLGRALSLPVLLAPTGLARLSHRDGEIAAARAAGREGTVFILSSASSYTIEEVADVAGGPLWFQLYPWRNEEVIQSLIQRARDAGYGTLCVTIDVPVAGKRERDLHHGVSLPPRPTPRIIADVLRHPAWLRDYLTPPRITFANLKQFAAERSRHYRNVYDFVNKELASVTVDWPFVADLKREWGGKFIVKGIMSAEAADAAVSHGADAVVVSNHGGRQLDGLPATLDVLPEVVDAVGGRAEVLLDGGVRRGSDVVKALALGATACLIGRPYLYGLAAGGAPGVRKALRIFSEEIDRTLALLGCSTLSELDSSIVRFPGFHEAPR